MTSSLYPARTKKNVEETNGTLALYRGEVRSGTALTVDFAKKAGKPPLS
jgi:hypothetical protein